MANTGNNIKGDQLKTLLKQQNTLLEQQNVLLQKLVDGNSLSGGNGERGVFVKDLERDEIRDGFLVSSRLKKLWNVQINLINEFARVCAKYNLRWFAIGGTLLGAVRHKGFIPWDDDVDVAMFRPDYEKFKAVAAKEIQHPYFADVWYNYQLECDEISELTDASLPLISNKERRNYPYSAPLISYTKLRDSRTLQLEFLNRSNVNQGIWIDIFPFDPLPYNVTRENAQKLNIGKILMIATTFPEIIENAMAKKQKLPIDYVSLEKFLKLPYKQRGIQYDKFMLDNFFESERVCNMWRNFAFMDIFKKKYKHYNTKAFSKLIRLPFEQIEVFAPADYEDALTTFYGENWRTPLFSHTHSKIYSADISYKEFFGNVKYM